jgi:hypothetical protein
VVDELGLDDLATGGEDEGYVPCDEGPATDTDLGADALAVAGEDGGFTPVGTGAASAPADESDTVAIFGTSSGFVAKPCSEITCVAQDTFTRVEAFGLGTSEFGPPWTSAVGSSVDGSVGHVLGGSIPRVVLPFALPVEILTKQRLNRGSGGYPTLAFDFFGGMTIHKGGSPSFTNLYWQLALFVYNAGFLGDNPGIPWSDTDVVLKVLARDEIGNVGSSAEELIYSGIDVSVPVIWTRMRAESGRVRGRAWLDGDPEPSTYAVETAGLTLDATSLLIPYTALMPSNGAWLIDSICVTEGL